MGSKPYAFSYLAISLILHITNKGNSYLALRKYEEAIQSYDKSIEIAPNNAAVFTYKGAALYNLGSHNY